jgi:hypothetical protein
VYCSIVADFWVVLWVKVVIVLLCLGGCVVGVGVGRVGVMKTNITGIIAEAKRSERERIIKLLENYEGLTGFFGIERDDLIALIKGENK